MNVVVIPCYKVKPHILPLLRAIPDSIHKILVVDDACPNQSGEYVKMNCQDPRIEVLFHAQNQGVGGAVITGYKRAIELQATHVIKLDGDGQMDPALLPKFMAPLQAGKADYVKGNRFSQLETLKSMPILRLFGNSVLSFVAKFSCGYWNIMDPTNGYTAIHATALRQLPLDKMAKRYFFESDMLFRLNLIRAVVKDIPIHSKYGDEKSNLRISRVALEFPPKYLRCFFKRLFYNYYLRDFNIASFEFLLGSLLFLFGLVYGLYEWWIATFVTHLAAANGVVMLAALPFILGVQFLLSAIHFDIESVPREPLQNSEL